MLRLSVYLLLIFLLLFGHYSFAHANSIEVFENNKLTSVFNSNNSFLKQQEHGTITISSSPESGMSIFLDGVNTGKATPATLENIPVGSHVLRLEGQWYRPQEKTVSVTEEQITRVDFTMVPAFAMLTVNSSSDAIIYIDNRIRGSTTWTGRVEEGVRKVRTQKEGFVTREWDVTMVRGRDQKIDLMLMPKTGMLEVITEPDQAMISLDGRLYGMTPRVIPDLLLGSYNLTIEKTGFTRVSMMVTIEDSKTTKVEVPLASGKDISITSEPNGAWVIIGNDTLGQTPSTFWIKFGRYDIKLVKDDEISIESINVTHSGKSSYSFNLKQSNDPFEKLMVFVKGGTFLMGDTQGIGNREEKPVHEVTLSDFYIGKHQVTQAQWKLIMGDNPSHFAGCDECPVERVSWFEVQAFIKKLNELTEKEYRLPTEAEWEYAAKGGELSQRYRYSGGNNINFVSWFSGNSGNKTNPVGQMKPNELGIYDMSGNVWEWCSDWLDDYTDTPKVNPKGPDYGFFRVVKGGSWFGYIGGSRVSCRGSDDPSNKRSYIGFRLALSP